MNPTHTPLNAHKHRHLKVRVQQGFGFAQGLHQADLFLNEFERAAGQYPIAFVREPASDRYRPVVLLSREGEGNAYVSHDGAWRSTYVPMVLRVHPFALAQEAHSENPVVCLEKDSDLLSHEEGAPLFDVHGEPAPALEQALDLLNEMHRQHSLTDKCCRVLSQLKLFLPLSWVGSKRGARLPDLSNCFMVDVDALEKLSDAALCLLREQGWLGAIYAHRVSLMQLDQLPRVDYGTQELAA
jgi:hypothetical protein